MNQQDKLEIVPQKELEQADDDDDSDGSDSSFEDDSDDDSEEEDDEHEPQHPSVEKTQRQLFLSQAMQSLLRGAVGSTGDLPSMMASTSVQPISRVGSDTAINRGGRILYHVQTASAVAVKDDQRKPIQVLRDILGEAFCIRSYRDYDFWAPWNSDGYTMELTSAVRQHDLKKIREIAAKGQNLQCTNKFGESVVHTAARRGAFDILLLFLEQGVSLRVCCEQGRNPLHDACWTGRPDFEVVKLLLEYEIRFLLAADKRGLIPLEYIPNAAWGEWEIFFNENRDLLLKY
ncbi:hypothetical protein FisN_16Hh146 [Fistulifera solaris]|jgi:hypothetical protein|uniref:Uncharacterized protein n=1 Tax=Fistulifera solaris TaxID=1519565 RepID=A0A1Z5KSW6_FISSO|nr:hypothetical protein FisN_16Hh146 [Fistulifera solaris]|eukprot:GAX29414.1 hypothetical protein FisN_16Hh146 [Fistulifera solaris]